MELTEALRNRRLERQIAMHEIDTSIKEKNMGRPKGSKNCNRPNGNQKVCGKTIYYHRLAHDMTQAEMAKKIGISARNLQRMENDPKFKTTRSTAYKVCYEIIFNPALANPEVIALVDKWNKKKK